MSAAFKTLNAINVNDNTEKKNGLTYLSWAWAWAELKKVFPDATYQIKNFDGKPYLYDENLGYLVMTEMTVDGITHEMWLPVMDGANKAMKDKPYVYMVKNQNHKWAKLDETTGKYFDKYGNEQPEFLEKNVAAATMFDINTAIMRCLTKNIAMFGLGLYIYAGEDLPEEQAEKSEQQQKEIENSVISEVKAKALLARCEKEGVNPETIKRLYKVNDFSELTEIKYRNINDHWEKIKGA